VAEEVELTWTSYTQWPAVIRVLAVPGLAAKTMGLEHEVPAAAEPAPAGAKPLSVARIPAGNFITEPISA
jgi:hypothetical protein